MKKEKSAGVFPALMTSFSDGGIDTDSITRLVEKLHADGVNGLYVGGSSAEMILCSPRNAGRFRDEIMNSQKCRP